MSLNDIVEILKGFEGHAGRPGKRGGSAPRSGGGSAYPAEMTGERILKDGQDTAGAISRASATLVHSKTTDDVDKVTNTVVALAARGQHATIEAVKRDPSLAPRAEGVSRVIEQEKNKHMAEAATKRQTIDKVSAKPSLATTVSKAKIENRASSLGYKNVSFQDTKDGARSQVVAQGTRSSKPKKLNIFVDKASGTIVDKNGKPVSGW